MGCVADASSCVCTVVVHDLTHTVAGTSLVAGPTGWPDPYGGSGSSPFEVRPDADELSLSGWSLSLVAPADHRFLRL